MSEQSGVCEHGSMACPDCDGVDDVQVMGQVIHGVECYEAWRDGQDCPHEQEDGQ